MFAVRDNRTGKFLANFSGSLNNFRFHAYYTLKKELGREVTAEEAHNFMFSCDTPEGAKLYKGESGVKSSFYSWCTRRIEGRLHAYRRIPLNEVCPWLQIVKVKISYACEE